MSPHLDSAGGGMIARAADAYETMEALICEMQGLRDELEEVRRQRDEAKGDLTLTESKHSYRPVKNAESSKSVIAMVSDTPETDANCWREGFNEWVSANLARKLERERDEARAMLEQRWHEEGTPLLQMMKERDEARLRYSTTLVFCQSLVKARLEGMEVVG